MKTKKSGYHKQVFALALVSGFILSYVFFDFYIQSNSGHSLIQLVKKVDSMNKQEVIDANLSRKSYRIFINGEEIVFSFENFQVDNLKVNEQLIDFDEVKKKLKITKEKD